jgi:hypothetical protein
MLSGEFFGGGVPKPTGNAPRGGSIEGNPNSVWVISSDLDRFKRTRVLGFIRPVVPLAGLPLYACFSHLQMQITMQLAVCATREVRRSWCMATSVT